MLYIYLSVWQTSNNFPFFYQGPKFYNTLTTEIINSYSPASFKKALKVTEQVRGCVAENHPHVHVILQKCLNLYIILKLTESKMTWKCFLTGEIEYKMYCDQQMQNEAIFINAANSCRVFAFRSKQCIPLSRCLPLKVCRGIVRSAFKKTIF